MYKTNYIIASMLFFILYLMSGCNSSSEPYIFISEWGKKGEGKGEFESISGIAIYTDDYIYITDYKKNCIQKFYPEGEFITKLGTATDYRKTKGKPPPDSYFISLKDITINSDKIYATDYSSSYVQVFDPNGKFLFKWGEYGDGEGQFLGPNGIAADLNGNIYVLDYRIQKFTSQGNFISKFEIPEIWLFEQQELDGLAIDSSGNIYISFTIATSTTYSDGPGEYEGEWIGYVQKYSPSGDLLKYWGAYGKEKPEFNNPRGIAIDEHDRIFVAETGANRIQVFDSDGNFLMEWGSEGSGKGQFKGPVDMAIDSEGNVYVVDAGNHRIQKFAPNPNYKPEN